MNISMITKEFDDRFSYWLNIKRLLGDETTDLL